jgi:hypothetical protein
MKKTINKLRQKPQHEKERIAFFGAFLMTLVILLFWLAGITAFDSNPDQSQAANVTSPADSFKKQFNDILNVFKK